MISYRSNMLGIKRAPAPTQERAPVVRRLSDAEVERRAKRPYSDLEDETIIELVRDRRGVLAICRELDRGLSSIQGAISRLRREGRLEQA